MENSLYFILVIFLFAEATQINAQVSKIKGRLLTPEEGCGISKARLTRIVGGSEAKPGAWPWMALLIYKSPLNNDTYIRCGGTLITSRHVLSAAHCITPVNYVRLGAHDVSDSVKDQNAVDVPVTRAIAHAEFSRGLSDIAMVYLEHDVEFNDKITPICLPIDDPLRSRRFEDENPFVAGWGRLSELGNKPHKLQQIQVPIVNNKKCQEFYTQAGENVTDIMFSDRVMCAGIDEGKSTCTGDSGGPLMLPLHENGKFPFYQIGIVSYAKGCAQKNVPTVYTRVQHYSDWIKLYVQF